MQTKRVDYVRKLSFTEKNVITNDQYVHVFAFETSLRKFMLLTASAYRAAARQNQQNDMCAKRRFRSA